MKNQATRVCVISRQEARRAARLHALVCIPIIMAVGFVIAYAVFGLCAWS